MFYKKCKAFNMIDRCDRFHASGEITDREMETLLEAIDVIWIAIHGDFENLVIDGESSLNCAEAKTRLKDKGILVKAKAPSQHARMVERRHAILRHAMHVTEEQLIDEGIRVTFKQLLAHCTFA